MGLDFHQSLVLQNANAFLSSALRLDGSKKIKSISELAEKLRTAVKTQKNQVILSLLTQGEWTLLEFYKKCAIGERYYQTSMTKWENFLRRFNEANVSVINTNSHIPPTNLFLYHNVVFYIPLLKFLMKCLIFLVMFFKIPRLLFNVQD